MKAALPLTLCLIPFFLPDVHPKKKPAKEQATVMAKHASVRMKNSPTSRTVCDAGTQTRARRCDGKAGQTGIAFEQATLRGWMEETTLSHSSHGVKNCRPWWRRQKNQEAQNNRSASG